MTEAELLEVWNEEKPMYEAWGFHIRDTVIQRLRDAGVDTESFLKIPPKVRLKDDVSLVDKAFYRSDKKYTDPYQQIEDKVGIRFVVLLAEDINRVCEILDSQSTWVATECRNYAKEREEAPLLFTYQSVHSILRPSSTVTIGDVAISSNVPCEVQVRTLLQHAHAELTHDAIYKSKKIVQPTVHRTVAKSMALIETTDEFFTQVVLKLNSGPLQEYKIVERLDHLYQSLTECPPVRTNASTILWDDYESVIDESVVEGIEQMFLGEYKSLADTIRNKYYTHQIYQQSIVLFLYWMLKNKKRRLERDWSLDTSLLSILASDVGVAVGEH
jgi:ppGpp synthetase/RelA/SpoT-type nucleotidyltranferase